MSGLETLALAATAVAGVTSAVGSIVSANNQAAALEANAATQRSNAGTALATAEAETQRTQRNTARALATAANTTAGLGVDPTIGTPLDVMADMAAEGALDAQIQRWKGRSTASNYLVSASNLKAEAGAMRTAGWFNAGTTLLGTAGQIGMSKMPTSGSSNVATTPASRVATTGRLAGSV